MLLLLSISLITISGCEEDDDSTLNAEEQTSPYLICANRNPGGVGIDLDSGKAYSIDDYEDYSWDLHVKTYKGVMESSGSPAIAGCPFIKLKDTTVSAYVYTATGKTAYESITLADVTDLGYSADTITSIALDSVDTVQSGEFTESEMSNGNFAVGNYYYAYTGKTGLKAQYKKLTVGETWKSVAANTDHGDDKIYIIKSDEGDYFKLIVTDFGSKSDIGESGYISIDYEKLQ